MPCGFDNPKRVMEDATEIAIYPIPLKVLDDIRERTKGGIGVEDVSEHYEETEAGKEFFSRIKGYIILATM